MADGSFPVETRGSQQSESSGKQCGQCGITKTRAEFHKRQASNDGLAACCKACQKLYDRQRLHKPDRVEFRANYRHTARGKERMAVGSKAWVGRNPDKRAARIAVGNAIADGSLVKMPCEACGSKEVDAHHDDYSKPLQVRWLCKKHHAEHHRMERLMREVEELQPETHLTT